MYILGAILTFSILVLVHEFGHFLMAKANKVKVEQFSIGMGPKLMGIKGKETEYSIRILPIGGYVKMLGDEGKSNDERAFNNKSPLQKLSIVAAGPIMNIILAVVLFAILGALRGFTIPIVNQVIENKPAYIAGLREGDKIVRVNNKKIITWDEVSNKIGILKGAPINVTFIRNGQQKSVAITPILDPEEKRYIIGVYPTIIEHPNLVQSTSYGLHETGFFFKETFRIFGSLFKGKVSANDIGGPISIIKISGAVAKTGILNLIFFGAVLSIQLAIFNIIPFPALDGGYIFLFIYEIITGRRVNEEKIGVINYIGFALLMTLMVLVTIKDILYPIKL